MRRILDFDRGWRYHKAVPGEDEASDRYGSMYVSSKTERIKNGPGAYKHFDIPNSWSFDEEIPNEKWENVNLPHDYIIGQTPDPEMGAASGFFHYHNAWYRKHFRVSPEYRDKRIALLFDGVSGNSTIYLNGCLIKYNHCAYTPFEADISDYVFFDRENVIAVYIDMSLIEGWWYRGAGIYRHVRMVVTDKLCVDLYGDYIYPVRSDNPDSSDTWEIPISTTIRNDGYDDADVSVVHHIIDKENTERAVFRTSGTVRARDKSELSVAGQFNNPELWDIDSPVLYTLVTEVLKDGQVCDTYSTSFGFRTARFDPDTGFWLNGRHVKITGVCAHQDFGLTGIALPDNIPEYKVRMLKDMGANGFRTSHYPHSPETMDALDRHGFLVLAEIRHFDSNEESMRQIELSVKRDRNRPSVIFWSTGNEELRYHNYEQGISIQRAMAAQVRKYDHYRPITSAVGKPENSVIMPYTDIIGINYSLHLFKDFHARYPDKPMVSTENCAVGSSYGNYTGAHKELGLLDARDHARDELHPGREDTWRFIAESDWICGGYQWDAFEHRGEAEWPRLCSASGAIDLFLQPKDAFYQNQSHWSDVPMIHLLPHWNLHGFEGRTVNVWAYTNCEEAELFLNGRSLGRKQIEKYRHGEWDIGFEPGELTAVGYINGKEIAREVRITAGEAYALKLREETLPIHAGLNEICLLTCYAVDRDGNIIPDARPFVRFQADNGAEISATGSANFDHDPVTRTERRMYAGRISVGVRAVNPGKTTIYAYADGLLPAILDINVLEKPEQEEIVSFQGEKIEAGHV